MASPNPLDPSCFDADLCSEEMNRVVELIEETTPPPQALPRTAEAAVEARRAFDENPLLQATVPAGRVEERRIEGPAGDLAVRIFRPDGEVHGAMLHIHGGGWVIGSASMNDVHNERRARELGLAVVSVDYRLAPEDPYPAGPDDCEAAALWLVENAASEFGTSPDKILVGGESAGGHLSAVTALRMLHRHGFRFCGANLVYGLYDLSGVPSHASLDHRNVLLNSKNIAWFTDCFVPEVFDRRDPDLSPLYADLGGAPPALFTVGTLDPLLDHTLFLYPRWLASGSRAELQIYPGAPHGFDMIPTPEGKRSSDRIDGFLSSCVRGEL